MGFLTIPDLESRIASNTTPVMRITLSCSENGYVSVMLPACITRAILRSLDGLAIRILRDDPTPGHQRTGRRGEEEAYFYLRRLGYTVVDRNFRSPRCRGEIDLIGWENDVLCFVEVKTRTSHDIKPAEAAVDYHKRREVALVAREYLRQMPSTCQWRFDVVSVYLGGSASRPQFELFRNASLAA
ncbi:MAG TPA: YraN family protein [Candidatus Sulfotelmatobacter sp.]|nr:YraN family protein [Candidatus Sulfotelmatobacter sp.]